MKKTDFNVAKHGFNFINSFNNYRYIGPLHLNFGGRCGGMVYTALDYFLAGIRIPQQNSLPVEGSVLGTYISARQEKSTLNSLDKWIELNFNPFGWRTRDFFNWGLQGFNGGRLEELRNEIDKNRPVPLGLFNPSNLIVHHQVLAIGYDLGKYKGDLKKYKSDFRIIVYDPNYPNVEKVLRADAKQLRYYYEDFKAGRDTKWLTYFVDLKYKPKSPETLKKRDSCPKNVIDVSYQNLSGRNIKNKDFRCSVCIGTNFKGATILQTDFTKSHMDRANFYGANLRHSNFNEADMDKTTFYGADLKNTVFIEAKVTHSNFIGADLKLSKLCEANLYNADFKGADLHRSDLSKTNCYSANFYGASLHTSKCEKADFRKANFYGADLRNANLRNADFRGANMHGANLAGADTTGAQGLP